MSNNSFNMLKMMEAQKTPFHLVPSSPWPLICSFSMLQLTLGMVLYFHYFTIGMYLSCFGFFSLIYFLYSWFLDILVESLSGYQTSYVANGLRLGFVLLIVSEVMFFFSFFWSYFHFSFSQSMHTGAIWPYVKGPYFGGLPLLNTVVLVLSSSLLTEAHLYFLQKSKLLAIIFLTLTIMLGAFFTVMQAMEYLDSPLTFNNGAYGSIFYMLTGFHGFHVLVGTIFLMLTLGSIISNRFLLESHILLEVSSLYWHFVDVIWLFLFIFVYMWGGI